MKVAVSILVGVVVFMTAMTFFNTANKVANSADKVVDKTLQADNVITNYERFFDLQANFSARVMQIAEHKSLIDDAVVMKNTDDANLLRVELAGMKQSCREIASQYNADASKINKNIFKSKNLPNVLNMESCE